MLWLGEIVFSRDKHTNFSTNVKWSALKAYTQVTFIVQASASYIQDYILHICIHMCVGKKGHEFERQQ